MPATPTPQNAAYRRMVLALLVAAYTLNFVDRTIVASIGQAIKADLKLTDTQLGLLGGLYFALLYTLLGIPIARLAERYSRRNIIAGAILIWSGFTVLCGTAASYASLAAYRFGVGVGEAGLSPPAHSLLTDHFAPERRASALSIYSLGVPLGTLIAAVAGTWLAQHYSWRWAFIALGIPGVLVALAIRLLVVEPPREDGAVAPPPTSLMRELREIGSVMRWMIHWPVLNMVLGITLISFGGYGGGQFVIPYFIRAFGLDYQTAGTFAGLFGAGGQVVGVLLGGLIADRMARRGGAAWYALVPAIGGVMAYPFILAIYTAPTWPQAIAWLAVPGFFAYLYMGPTYAVIQNVAPVSQRATATAVLLLVLNLIALGGGPPFAGWTIDHLAAFHFLHTGQSSVVSAIGGWSGVETHAFAAACPGGIGLAGPGAADSACRTAVTLGTRQGVLIAYAFGLWGAGHYVIAAFGLGQLMNPDYSSPS